MEDLYVHGLPIVFLQLSDAQVLAKIMDVCQRESIEYTDDGLEAVVFTAQGDMRQGNVQTIGNFIKMGSQSFLDCRAQQPPVDARGIRFC